VEKEPARMERGSNRALILRFEGVRWLARLRIRGEGGGVTGVREWGFRGMVNWGADGPWRWELMHGGAARQRWRVAGDDG
jgi:hypothetical protein